MGLIEVSNLFFSYPTKKNVLNGISLNIEEGKFTCIVGENGSGIFYKKDDYEKVINLMKHLELYDIRKTTFADLSGGQQQRVLIVRAVCATEKLIVLDEPTNGLDPSIAKQIYELLDHLKNHEKITIMMVSHDIDRALKYADNVIEIHEGKVQFEGSASNYVISFYTKSNDCWYINYSICSVNWCYFGFKKI